MTNYFLGYRDTIGHLLHKTHTFHDDRFRDDQFLPSIRKWCDHNLGGYVNPVYVGFDYTDLLGIERRGARFEFDFEFEEDVVIFKLFHL